MRQEIFVQSDSRDAIRGNQVKVVAWGLAADAAVGPSSEWCLVNDRVAPCGLNAFLPAPLLRKDVVNVNAFVKITRYGRPLARYLVTSTFAQQQGVQAFVRGAVSRAQR